jgi:hypothetical protein
LSRLIKFPYSSRFCASAAAGNASANSESTSKRLASFLRIIFPPEIVERFVYRAAAVRLGVGRMRREEVALPDRKSKLELSFGLGLSDIDE